MEEPIKILIVEDNVIIADDMQSMLEEIGYEIVDNVIVYEQAIEVLKEKQVDLVLIDIILASDKTGIDLGKLLETAELARELTGTAPGGRASAWLRRRYLSKT